MAAAPGGQAPARGRGLRRRVGGRLMGTGAWTLVAVLLLAAAAVFVAGRTVTLQWAAQQAVEFSDGRLQIDGISGSVLTEIAADAVSWRDNGLAVTVVAPRLTYHPLALLDGLIRVERISAADVIVGLPPDPPEGEPRRPIRLPPAMAAMLPVSIERFDAGRVVVRRDGSDLLTLNNLEAVFRHDGDRINASLLNLDLFTNDTRIGIRGEAAVIARAPYVTDGRLAVQVPLQPRALRVDVRLNGPLEKLAVRADTAIAGAPVEARSVLHPLESRPLRQVRLEVKDLDLARYDRSLPTTRLAGTYEAEVMPAWASERRPLLIGPMKLENGLAGPLDRRRVPLALAEAVVSWAEGRLVVQTLKASGPVGELSGEGGIGRGGLRLALESNRLQLRAINSSLKPRIVAARLAVEPSAAARADDASGKAKVASGPGGGRAAAGHRIDLEATDALLSAEMKAALVDGNLLISRAQVRLKPARAGALAGVARFGGEVGMTAPWAVDLSGDFRDFDPAQLAALPAARLNGQWTVAGHAGAAAPLQAELTLADSQLRGLPLEGRLAAEVVLKGGEAERLSAVTARFRWGAGTVDVAGAIGAEGDALRVAFDLPKIAELRIGLRGVLRGEGQVGGALRAPIVDGSLRGTNLVVNAAGLQTRIDSANLQLATARSLDRRMTLQVQLEQVAVAPAPGSEGPGAHAEAVLAFERVDATLRGSIDEHAAEVEARGKGQHLALAADGSLDDGFWHGTIRHLQGSHPALRSLLAAAPAAQDGTVALPGGASGAGEGNDFRALQPFVIGMGAGYFSARDARFGIHGAELGLRHFDWQAPVLAVRGDATGIEARWLGRFLGRYSDLLSDRLTDRFTSHLASRFGDRSPDPVPDRSPDRSAPWPSQDLRLVAAVDFRGSLADSVAADWRGVLQVRREDGDLVLARTDDREPVKAGLKTFEASASIADRVLELVANIDGQHVGWMSAEAQVNLPAGSGPVWSLPVLARSPLAGRLQMATDSVRWIAPVAAGDWQIDGAVAARLALAGTLGAPRAEGIVTGNDLDARDPLLGLHLTSGVFAAELVEDRLDVQLLRFATGEGSVAISGSGGMSGNGGGSEARVVVDRLAIPLGGDQQVVLSGSTTATLRDGALGVAGRLVADEGAIDLAWTGDPDPAVDGDAAVDGLGTDAGFQVDVDVELDLGRLFRVTGGGLDAHLAGAIRLSGSLPQSLRADGTVDLANGSLELDGQPLRIGRGRVVFDGPPRSPLLDIVATRDDPQRQRGIAISGPAASPTIELIDEAQERQVVAHDAVVAIGRRLSTRLFEIYAQSLRGIREILKLKDQVTDLLSPEVVPEPSPEAIRITSRLWAAAPPGSAGSPARETG